MAESIIKNPNYMGSAKSYTLNGLQFVFRKYGRVVIVVGTGSPTNDIPTNGYVGTQQIDPAFYPLTPAALAFYILARAGIGFQINISNAGEFKYGYASQTIGAQTNVYCSFAYISAS